jgi:isocitrate/isopropylmalate dehydrogenase
MLLDFLGEETASDTVRAGVSEALETGVRTADLAAGGTPPVSTANLGALVRLCMKRHFKKVMA